MTVHWSAVVSLMACGQVGLVLDGSSDVSPPIDGSDAAIAASPDVIFGDKLLVWLDADEATTLVDDGDGGVIRWNDRSQSHYDAPAYLKGQITANKSIANGHAALSVGANKGMFEIPFGGVGGFDFVIAMVAAYSNPATLTGTLLECAQLSLVANWMSSSVIVGSKASSRVATSQSGWNDGRFHAFGLRSDYGVPIVGVRADGVETIGSMAFLWPSLWWPLFIGGHNCNPNCDGGPIAIDYPLEGYVAEVIVAVRTPGTPLELAQLSAYFQKKYGLLF